MTATAAEALELALWLHRAPARRAALLGRPLPDGIGQLLRVASGARDQVAAAATITGVDEATILEAVRFYVQQVLFHEDADAYRVLGLRPDATQERAREHHRLLQQWLHPDRNRPDAWVSVYAVRINQAWTQLRTPQSRAAYDAGLKAAGAGPVAGGGGNVAEYREAMRPVAAPGPTVSRSRSRNLTLLVLLGCAGLLVLVALRNEEPPEWLEERVARTEADAAARGNGDASANANEPSPLATLGAAFSGPPDPVPGDAPSVPAVLARSSPDVVGVVPATAPADARASHPAVARIDAPGEARSMPGVRSAAEAVAKPVRTVAVPAPSAPAGPAESVSRQPPAQAAVLAASPPASAPVRPVPPAPAVAVAASPVPIQVPDAFERMTLAQQRTRAVLDYLGDPQAGLPPVWNDVGTMQNAGRIHTALHARRDTGKRVALDLQAPKWRLSSSGAHLESRYRAGKEQGRIDLAFTWREEQMLVSGIALEPDA